MDTLHLGKWQICVLNKLLDQYEKSKTYMGENLRPQSFSVKASDVFEQYEDDLTDVDLVHEFENQMRGLSEEGLLLVSDGRYGVMKKLTAVPECWESYYQLTGRIPKKQQVSEELTWYQELLKSMGSAEKISGLKYFCKSQISRLEKGKKAQYSLENAKILIKLWSFILCNEHELMERELSALVLADTKLWEEKYRSKLCSLLLKYEDHGALLEGIDPGREQEKILLEEYHIFANPSYIYLKGNAEIYFQDGQRLHLSKEIPMGFTEESLHNLQKIVIQDQNVMTVENLTTFHRMSQENIFYVFLSGYHNTLKQKVLCRIHEENPGLYWLHFGDIDPDGFYIVEHLKRMTGIDFQPVYMGVEQLQEFSEYTKPLENKDIIKAKNLLEAGLYPSVMEYMLKNERKLEQEIIGLNYSKRKCEERI